MASVLESLIQYTDDIALRPWLRIENVFQKEVTDNLVRAFRVGREHCPNYARDFDQTDVDNLAADGFPAQLVANIVDPSIDSATAISCYDLGDLVHAKLAARDAYRIQTVIVIGLTAADVTQLVNSINDVRSVLETIINA